MENVYDTHCMQYMEAWKRYRASDIPLLLTFYFVQLKRIHTVWFYNEKQLLKLPSINYISFTFTYPKLFDTFSYKKL